MATANEARRTEGETVDLLIVRSGTGQLCKGFRCKAADEFMRLEMSKQIFHGVQLRRVRGRNAI